MQKRENLSPCRALGGPGAETHGNSCSVSGAIQLPHGGGQHRSQNTRGREGARGGAEKQGSALRRGWERGLGRKSARGRGLGKAGGGRQRCWRGRRVSWELRGRTGTAKHTAVDVRPGQTPSHR